MPAPFGVTPTGFNRPTQREIIALMEQDQLAEMDSDLDVSPDGTLGQLNGIYSRPIDKLWQELETIFHAFDPDAAEDLLLTFLAKLTGTERRAAASSETPCTIVADEGTIIEAGVNFASVAGKPDIRFTPKETFTAVGAGPYNNVIFRSEETGPVEAPAGFLTVIATPVSGWTSITNSGDATGGRVADEDPTVRLRREQQLTRAGSSTLDAIRADLLAIDEIEHVEMFENVKDTSDSNGLPPHTYEAVIWDGSPPAASDDAIAQVLWDSNHRSFGSSSGTATDANGIAQPMRFTRSTAKQVYLIFDMDVDGAFVDADFRAAVAEQANAIHNTGADVFATRLIALAWAQPGVTNVHSVKLGFAPTPTLSLDLTVAIREIARFDSGNISVT
jgi:hypothetical protein